MLQISQRCMARRQLRESLCLEEKAVIVMAVGAYREAEGVLDFLKTAEEMPDVIFLWYGETPGRQVRRRVRKAMKGAPDNVCFMGEIEADELREGCLGADVYLNLSYEETEDAALQEVLYCGLPVIARDIPGCDFRLKDMKDMSRVRDVEDAVACIRRRVLERALKEIG